jgi:hypothetical protein
MTDAIAARPPACFETGVMAKPGKAEKWAARSARLAAALRENLKRRKEQARERDLARNHPNGEKAAPENAKLEMQVPEFRRNQGRE